MDKLKNCLINETRATENFKKQYEEAKGNSSELMKDEIIADQIMIIDELKEVI